MMARASQKRKPGNKAEDIPIRTTPRKRKQVEYTEAASDLEDSPSVGVEDGPPSTIKRNGKLDNPTEGTVEEEVDGTVEKVEGKKKVTRETTRNSVQAKPTKVSRKTNSKTIKDNKTKALTENPEDSSDDEEAEKPKKKRKTKEEMEAEAMPLAPRTPGLKMFVGAHTSVAKGVENAITNAVHIGGNAFACFLKSQRKWDNPALKDENRDAFKRHLITHKYDSSSHIVPHGSYLVNLASADKDMAKKSYDAFIDDLRRCEALGIKHYNFHPGAAGQAPMAEAIGRLANNLNRALAETTTVTPLLENMATRGTVIGGRFQDLRDVIALIKPEFKSRIGVCIDTCHTFASGYDLRTPESFKKTLSEFDEVVGIKYLKALHLNDSKAPFASNRDLHQNIGLGFLGLRAFHNVMNEPRFQNLPLILETPCEKPDPKDPTGKKTLEDKGVWAAEIKLLENLIGMDPQGEEFKRLERNLSDKGKAERAKMQKQFDEKQTKDAKKLAKETEAGQKSLKDMFGGQKRAKKEDKS